MPQQAAGEGCSGAKGPDEEDSEQDESDSGRSAEDCGGANCSDEENSEREKIATDINQSINQSTIFIYTR